MDKSVSFAARHQVVSVLSTPQVPAGGGRFVVADENTKERDGEAGVQNVRRLSQVPIVQNVIDEAKEKVAYETNGPQEGLKVGSWNDSECEPKDDEDDNDKTVPLPDEEEYNISGDDTTDPPVDANTCDPMSNKNQQEKIKYPSHPNDHDVSMRSVNAFPELDADYTKGKFVKVDHQGGIRFSYGKNMNIGLSMTCPYDIAYVQHRNAFIVPETFRNRIGVYDACTWNFQYWLSHPRHQWYKPSSVLVCNNHVLIVENDRIQIYDEYLNPVSYKVGYYYGLAAGKKDEVYTISYLKGKEMAIQKLCIGPNGFYKFDGQIKLKISYPKASVARFLHYSCDKIFVTDLGLHKMYIVDLKTGEQAIHGNYGSNHGQFTKPTGLISDDRGNILVVDRDNKRLLVFNGKGKFVKVAETTFDLPSGIQNVRRCGDDFFLVHIPLNDQKGGILHMNLTL